MPESNLTTPYGLTPVQEQVLAAITGGATMKAAAAAASIHRNTCLYWRRTSAAFREALSQAQYDKAIFIREEAEGQVADAFAAIHTILTKPDASDTARLNAAKFIIEKASTPPPPKPEVLYEFQNAEIVHSPAQTPTPEVTPEPSAEPQKPEIVHNFAQSASPSAPKTGRNDLCPCGSHLKFKRCCLGKPPLSAAA
jgi:hypothetical protein